MTEVEVTFSARGSAQTLVVLEHRDLERYGEKAAALRTSIDSAGGWTKVVEEFAKCAEATDFQKDELGLG